MSSRPTCPAAGRCCCSASSARARPPSSADCSPEPAGDADDVTSPTFTLIQQYAGRLPVTHVDLYRLSAPEADDLGLDEIVAGGGIVAIEWADRLPRPPAGAVQVRIEDDGADTRSIRIERA